MTEKGVKRMLLGVVVSTAIVALAPAAMASHYRLEYLEFLDRTQVEAYGAAGLETTEDFLLRTLTQEERRRLSDETGVSELEILVLARLCELLQIEGIGPRAAQLLRAAGVIGVDDLARRDPAQLAERLVAVNTVEQLTGVDPSPENLADWITAAERVPYHVQ